LSEAQRRDNLRNCFRVVRTHEVTGKRVLVIDDVFTTGATLRAAAAALKSAGAAYVCALTLARVDRRTFGFDIGTSGARETTASAGSGGETKNRVREEPI
jgi:orotate phosphoribosyltransferase